ncbi:unnamed protein product [Hymenolepis diminuta]|uniref:Amidase domain-containing protein n=1 Tax=Hymenolepis diminuta TaxID=6216 RepID=A0A0R3S8N5_HYMDI|nr:unnamed protein product [Hymenolepis diminuta]VUZ43599.1 unnamed protein product [Hymenolepis diminuta]
MNKLPRLLASSISLVNSTRRCSRFVPSKPLWRWHDDRSPCSDESIFFIPPEEIPSKIELDDQTLKLLERLSLVSFNEEKTKEIVEEAIHFADCLLTPSAFRGEGVTRATVEPMFSLLGEEGFEPMSMMTDDEVWSQEETAETAAHIVSHAAVTWEKYFVAPPGNKSIHPELNRSENELETEK